MSRPFLVIKDSNSNVRHRYIKHLDTARAPWLPDSEFAQLDAELRYWYENLPANLQFTPTTLYIRQETSQVGALCALHYAYHQTMCDLYRIGESRESGT